MTERLKSVLYALKEFPGSTLHLGVGNEMCDELLAAGGTGKTTIHSGMGNTGKPRAIDSVSLHHEGVELTAQRDHRALTPDDL